jgi:hypothetical protein
MGERLSAVFRTELSSDSVCVRALARAYERAS